MGLLYLSVICCMWATAQCWVLWILPPGCEEEEEEEDNAC